MAIATWSIKPENEILDTTKIKEADNKLKASIDDLVTWVNGTGGYVGTGVKYDVEQFLTTSTTTFNTFMTDSQTAHDTAMTSRATDWTSVKGTWQTEFDALKVTWQTQLQSVVDTTTITEW